MSSLWFTCNGCCSPIWFLPRFPEPDILMAVKEPVPNLWISVEISARFSV